MRALNFRFWLELQERLDDNAVEIAIEPSAADASLATAVIRGADARIVCSARIASGRLRIDGATVFALPRVEDHSEQVAVLRRWLNRARSIGCCNFQPSSSRESLR